ncbi:MAG: DinB family protein [Blastocatellia bacterium]
MKEARRSFLLEPADAPLTAAQAFVRHARFRLSQDYPVKISGALAELTDAQLWWRPNEASNSIGNLILHLCGNVRQWMIAGVGGATDTRDRNHEFVERRQIGKDELLILLKTTLAEVDAALEKLEQELIAGSDAPLQRQITPQGFAQTVLDSVFHVVEHFSYHTGQIVFIAKLLAGERIRFYDDRQLDVRSEPRLPHLH